jgi:dipeptidyl aminopeptidase/acylaminoacyl peptidase
MRSQFAALCAAVLSALPVLAQATVPLAAFVHEDEYYNPRLSPDGKHIAITTRIPSGDRFVPVLTMYSLPDMKITGAIRLPKFEVPASYAWVSPTRLVVAKGRELGSREKPVATGELVATNVDGTKQEYLFGYDMWKSSSRGDRYGDDHAYGYVEDVSIKRDGRVYVTSRAWEGKTTMLYEIDSVRATRKLIAEVPEQDLTFILQTNGQPRFAVGAGADGYAVEYRYDDAGKSWSKLEKNLGRHYQPLVFNAADTDFAATHSPKGGPQQLIRENLATGVRTVLFADEAGDVEGIQSDVRTRLPYAAHASIGRPKTRYFDDSSEDAKLHKMLSAQFPDHFLRFVDASDDGKFILFYVASDRDPGSYYLFDRGTMNATMLFSGLESINPDLMAERRPISFKARDGMELHGFLTLPPQKGAAPAPLVVLPHGGPHGPSDDWFFDTDAQFLASRGYAVLQVNFRGSGGRGTLFEEAGYRQWGGKIMNDLVDGTRWAIAQGHADGDRVCAYGASFGGYASMMLAALEPSLYKCAVGYAGVYDLKLLSKRENNRQDERNLTIIKRYVGDDRAELDRNSPVMLAERIKAPVMLVHGGLDKIAPVDHAHAMRAALTAVGRPPEWFLAPSERHGFYDTANRTAFYEKLEAFLGKHIGKGAAAK